MGEHCRTISAQIFGHKPPGQELLHLRDAECPGRPNEQGFCSGDNVGTRMSRSDRSDTLSSAHHIVFHSLSPNAHYRPMQCTSMFGPYGAPLVRFSAIFVQSFARNVRFLLLPISDLEISHTIFGPPTHGKRWSAGLTATESYFQYLTWYFHLGAFFRGPPLLKRARLSRRCHYRSPPLAPSLDPARRGSGHGPSTMSRRGHSRRRSSATGLGGTVGSAVVDVRREAVRLVMRPSAGLDKSLRDADRHPCSADRAWTTDALTIPVSHALYRAVVVLAAQYTPPTRNRRQPLSHRAPSCCRFVPAYNTAHD
ncbi:hypothetical protein DFH06DRAFT_1432548 [Mycena polygramma]|nr:hypothetical protein DFH06DRAFT_1432548 [Mycena polygramma]